MATAARRSVNLSLSPSILARARAHTSNLSATVEQLLTRFVDEQQKAARETDSELARVIAALNTQVTSFLSDEFPSL